MPKYRFKWANLPGTLLKALCRDLDLQVDQSGPAAALAATYGARPREEFVRDAWPTLRESWLSRDRESRGWVVEQLRQARREPELGGSRNVQMELLRRLNNSKNLRGIVLDEFIVIGEIEADEPIKKAPAKRAQTSGGGPSNLKRAHSAAKHKSEPASHAGSVNEELVSAGESSTKLVELEARLWGAANALRGPVDPADFKTYVFPMLFWKWISDTWDWEHAQAVDEFGDDLDPEIEADYHRFDLPDGTHWREVTTKTDNVGSRINTALGRIEQANPKALAGIFGDAYWGNKERLPESALMALVNALNGLTLNPAKVTHDMLGQAYEYLLKNFADESGKKAGEFFTPRQVVHLLVGILDPRPGESVYDPASGSGGMLVDTINNVRASGGDSRTLRLYAQEVNLTTAAIARMNLFLHEIEDFQVIRGDTLRSPGLRSSDGSLRTFDVVIANPPFSLQNWGADVWAGDTRAFCGVPPAQNGDFAWIQHMIASMSDNGGRVGVVMPHGVLFRRGVEARIRQCLVEQDRLEAVIGLPPKLFYSTGIPACLLIFKVTKPEERRSHVLFVDGSSRFVKERNQNVMSQDDVEAILAGYRTGKDPDGEGGVHVRLVPFDEIKANDFELNLGRYVRVDAEEAVDLDAALAIYQDARAARLEAEQGLFERFVAAGIADLGRSDD